MIARPLAWLYLKLRYHHRIINKKVLKSAQESGYYLYANHTCADADPLIPTMAAYPKAVYAISLNDHEHAIKYFELSANEQRNT